MSSYLITEGRPSPHEYFWLDGSIHTLTVKDVIDPDQQPIRVSFPIGGREDKNARIFPFKVHHGKQPYDPVHKTLLAPILSGDDGYWKTLDWPSTLEKGMAALGIPFSGKFDFVESTYVYPSTHMVAPKEAVVKCSECHVRTNGRLAALTGFYMPGRDRFALLDLGGWLIVFGSLGGVLLHALGRVFVSGLKDRRKKQ